MTENELLALAEGLGYDKCVIIDTDELSVVHEYRKYCEMNTCGNYNANYGCPPDCGTPEEMEQHLHRFRHALVMVTHTKMKDPNDLEEVKAVGAAHRAKNKLLVKAILDAGLETERRLMLTGKCTICDECAKTKGRPCTFPKLRSSCLSAYGVDVNVLARTCGVELVWDGSTLSYFSLYLFDENG